MGVAVVIGVAVVVGITVTIAVGVGVTIAVGVAVVAGVAVTVAVGVGATVGMVVTVAVGVGVADTMAGADVDGAAVEVGEVVGAEVFGARVACEVTCPELARGAQPDTLMQTAASKPASDAMASGRPNPGRSDRPRYLPGWTGAGLEASASLADLTALVALPVSGYPASVEVTGPDS